MLVMGIDPGLKYTGFGIIEVNCSDCAYMASGVISTNEKSQINIRLLTIFNGMQEIIKKYKPDQISMEKVFANVNPKTTLLLGHARGVAMCAASLYVDNIFEYTALQIKKSVVGYGHASKEQIQEMVRIRLNLNAKPSEDAADALACAVTHSQYSSLEMKYHANKM
jgi:crossover junction endodeoxyribonuclease RuvC